MNPDVFFKNFELLADAPNGVQKLREMILQLAVMGKLVEQNLKDEPASILIEKIRVEKKRLVKEEKIREIKISPTLDITEIAYELPQGWEWCRWNDISMQIGDLDHKMPLECEEGIPYVSPKDFYDNNGINFITAKKISRDDFERLRQKIQPEKNDIIFPRYGTIGENRFVVTENEFLASYSCAVIKSMNEMMEPKYSYYYSLSPLIKSEIIT
jgi:type I restriction enzyme S subunit